MHGDDDAIAAWDEVFARVTAAQASPLYMPASLLVVLVSLAIERDGVVRFDVFEPLFASLVSVVHSVGEDKAWEPFFHLSRSAGLWVLHEGAEPADFGDVPGGRPKGRSRLLGKADRAVVTRELRPALEVPERRAVVLSRLAEGLLADEDARVRRLVVVAGSLPEATPGLLHRAGLAVGDHRQA